MSTLYRIGSVAACCAALVMTACDDSNDGTARLDVRLTDAAGDVAAVWVDVSQIYLQGPGGRTDLLPSPTGLIELTSLAGTTLGLVEDVVLAPGSYGQLRFVVDAAVLETLDGSVYAYGGAEHPDELPVTGDLVCPSCNASGLKVLLGPAGLVIEEGDNILVLDFDVARSFGRMAGGSGQWVMNPLINGTQVLGGVPSSLAGTVVVDGGVVIPACGGTGRGITDFVPLVVAQNLADDEGMPLTWSGVVQEDGSFVIGSLPADDYELSAMATFELDGGDALQFAWTPTPTDITVSEGEDATDVMYTITNATCLMP